MPRLKPPWEGSTRMARRLLVLDIGLTTGYAIYMIETGDLMEYGEITEHAYRQELKRLRDQHVVSRSIAERPLIVRGKLGDRLQKLIAITDQELMRQIEYCEAKDWKPSPSSKHPTPRGTSQHIKDAIRIGHWYLGRL